MSNSCKALKRKIFPVLFDLIIQDSVTEKAKAGYVSTSWSGKRILSWEIGQGYEESPR